MFTDYAEQLQQTVDNEFQILSRDSVDESLQRLSIVGRENNFKVLLTVFPNFTDLDHYAFGAEHEKMRKLAEELGFEYLDLLDTMRDCARKAEGKSISFDLYHPTVTGHDCVARALSEKIAGMKYQASDP